MDIPIVMPFGTLTQVGLSKHILDGGREPRAKMQFWGWKVAGPGHLQWSVCSKWLSRGQNWYGADAN